MTVRELIEALQAYSGGEVVWVILDGYQYAIDEIDLDDDGVSICL